MLLVSSSENLPRVFQGGTNHKLVTGCWVPKAHRCTRATEAILSGPSQQKIYHSTSHTKFVMPFQMQVQEESNHSVQAHHYKRIKAAVPPTILPASLHLPISSSISVIFPLCSTTIGGLNSEFKPSLGPPLRTASHVHVPLTINTKWNLSEHMLHHTLLLMGLHSGRPYTGQPVGWPLSNV